MTRIFTFFVLITLAACKPPVVHPTNNESATPSPSAVQSTPTPEATPSPTLTPSPTPVESATPEISPSASPSPSDSPSPSPTESPTATPEVSPSASPSPSLQTTDSKNLPKADGFVGVWAAQDEYKDTFNIVLAADGRAVANWSNGRNGGRGERGQWRVLGNDILIFYNNGWTDYLTADGDAFRDSGYSADNNLKNIPASQSPVTRVEGPMAVYAGVWRLDKQSDGSYIYVSLQSDGDAESTNPSNGLGKWTLAPEGAKIIWADKSSQTISKQGDQFTQMFWPPKVNTKEPPTDSSEAFKVGNVPAKIAP
ncbi:MAG: hypothetical protein ABI443_00660 [Chthoniobacterales bacterium]